MTTNANIPRHAAQESAFHETLKNTQERFRSEGIDFRIIGSLAAHAHLDVLGDTSLSPLDFNRAGAATPDQRVPDIDMIVPRNDLATAREIRSDIAKNEAVKIGLAVPTTEINFRPDEDNSFLTHKDLSYPVSNELFRAEMASLHGVDIQTIPLDTLLHTFGTFGGMIRHKDIPMIRALAKNSAGHSAETEVFHEFQRRRREASPAQYRMSRTVEMVDERAPRRVRNELYKYALKAADVLGKR